MLRCGRPASGLGACRRALKRRVAHPPRAPPRACRRATWHRGCRRSARTCRRPPPRDRGWRRTGAKSGPKSRPRGLGPPLFASVSTAGDPLAVRIAPRQRAHRGIARRAAVGRAAAAGLEDAGGARRGDVVGHPDRAAVARRRDARQEGRGPAPPRPASCPAASSRSALLPRRWISCALTTAGLRPERRRAAGEKRGREQTPREERQPSRCSPILCLARRRPARSCLACPTGSVRCPHRFAGNGDAPPCRARTVRCAAATRTLPIVTCSAARGSGS